MDSFRIFIVAIEIVAVETKVLKGIKVESKRDAGGTVAMIGAFTEAKAEEGARQAAAKFLEEAQRVAPKDTVYKLGKVTIKEFNP